MNRRRAAQEGETEASRLRSAPAHLHRKAARQRGRSVSAAAGRRRAGSRAQRAQPEQVIDNGRICPFRFARRGGRQRAGLADVLGPGVLGYRHRPALGQLSEGSPPNRFTASLCSRARRPSAASRIVVSARSSAVSSAAKASLLVQYASSAKWEEAPMQPQPQRSRLLLPASSACRKTSSITWKRRA